MAKLPGLVNYSDDEDQSSSSSVEDDTQQDHKQQQQQQQQPPSTQHHQTPQSSSPSQTLETSKDSRIDGAKDKPGKQGPSPLSNEDILQPQEANSPAPLPTVIPIDRSSRLSTILTPKPLPGVENWGVPPEPQTDCDPERLEKIQHFLSLRRSGHRLNEHLQRNKAFRNPRIYAKLVEFVDLNETGSNFPPDQFDPTSFPATSFIDGILETQRQLAEEKGQTQAQGRSQIAFTPSAPTNKPPMDASAKFAAAMANAAKIANKIAKPTHLPPAPPPPAPPTASSTTESRHHEHSSSSKRSSHRKWDRQDDRKRHHH